MPGLVRKVLIFSAVDGLVIQPTGSRNQRTAPSATIDYRSHAVKPLLQDVDTISHPSERLEVFGIVGLLKVANAAYLISISRKTQVAQLLGRPIFVVTGISIVPLSSHAAAKQAIEEARAENTTQQPEREGESIPNDNVHNEDIDSLSTDGSSSFNVKDSPENSRQSLDEPGRSSLDGKESGIVEDVISRRGVYGRFAERWFSNRGWTTTQRRMQGMSSQTELSRTEEPTEQISSVTDDRKASSNRDVQRQWPHVPATEQAADEAFGGPSEESITTTLLPKLVQTTKLLLTSGTFFFSYDHDLTHDISRSHHPSDLPLFKQAESQYFWNENLLTPLVDSGFDEYALPIMQGFVGQREFSMASSTSGAEQQVQKLFEEDDRQQDVDEKQANFGSSSGGTWDFHLTLISRRSKNRAGLRYLRRGIDEDGNTANEVETEQIWSHAGASERKNVWSFVQTRGSIPLFYSQLPYSFKPPPSLFGSAEANQAAFRRHFSTLSNRYGAIQAISLIDSSGVEAKIGEAYEENVQVLNAAGGVNNNPVGFNWFKFHEVCRGMKFENVSILVDDMSKFLNESGWFNVSRDGTQKTTQRGIIRTNCMDCLDRTNVVQSALAQHVLENQMSSSGLLEMKLISNQQSWTWFITLWADNGDAISRAYTGTSALKGDYTRTRKRNLSGAITDLTLSLSRYYHNLFDDFFTQACIDFLLGSVTEAVFSEFEATMTTADPAVDIRKARQSAISTAVNVVLSDDREDFMNGWTLLSPSVAGTLRTFPFTESILLLTDKSIYAVKYDWNLSSVLGFERIPFENVTAIHWGDYITETNVKSQLDGTKNAGFVICYKRSISPVKAKEETQHTVERDSVSTTSPVSLIEKPSIIRANTQTIENQISDPASNDITFTTAHDSQTDIRFLSFKALPPRSSILRPFDRKNPSHRRRGSNVDFSLPSAAQGSERDAVKQIIGELELAIDSSRVLRSTGDESEGIKLRVEERDVLGYEEARKLTGWVESWGWSFKKALWG